MTMDQHAFETFRREQRRRHTGVWIATLVITAGLCFLLGIVWSYLAGLAAAVIIPLLAYELIREWNRRCWLNHFPELRDGQFPWIVDRHGGGGRIH